MLSWSPWFPCGFPSNQNGQILLLRKPQGDQRKCCHGLPGFPVAFPVTKNEQILLLSEPQGDQGKCCHGLPGLSVALPPMKNQQIRLLREQRKQGFQGPSPKKNKGVRREHMQHSETNRPPAKLTHAGLLVSWCLVCY